MPTTLRDDLRQTRPFDTRQQEAYLNVLRTAAVLLGGVEEVLRPHGLSSQQYNVLRILRGAGADGLCRNELRDRLLTRMPDVTRMLDRMEEAGLVVRERQTDDRRLVSTRISPKGRRLVDALDAPVAAEHARGLGHLSAAQLDTLSALLTLARQRA